MYKKVLTTHEVAQYCNVTITTVVNWVKDGSLKAYKTKGGHRRINKNDLIDFLKKHNMPVTLKSSILIVDDDEAIRVGLKKILENAGYEVYVASNGFEAGRLFEMKQPSLVVLDIVMPILDGFSVCEYIKEHKELKDTRILVLTGYFSKENIEKSKKAGVDKCLAKPIDQEAILNEIKNLIGMNRE